MPPEHLREVERMLDETQRMLVRLQDQREAQDRRILELENELTRRRADLQALQDRLDRQLDGL
jgi:septal ring factor EnvC (AmiA/AmiB activator)